MGFVGLVGFVGFVGFVGVVGEDVLLLIIIVILPFTVLLLESFAVTLTIVAVIGDGELPDTSPLVALIVNPAGNVGAENCVNPVVIPVGVELYVVLPITPLIGI